MSHLLEDKVYDGEVELCAIRIEQAFRGLLLFLAFATVLLVANACLTMRQMSRAPEGCLFGCSAVGGDALRHDLACPRFAACLI